MIPKHPGTSVEAGWALRDADGYFVGWPPDSTEITRVGVHEARLWATQDAATQWANGHGYTAVRVRRTATWTDGDLDGHPGPEKGTTMTGGRRDGHTNAR